MNKIPEWFPVLNGGRYGYLGSEKKNTRCISQYVVLYQDMGKIFPCGLVIIPFSGFVNLLYGFYVGKYVDKSMKERSDDEKKESYMMRTLENRMFAKDIRLYDMKDRLYGKFRYYHERHSEYLLGEMRIRVIAIILNAVLVLARDLIAYGYLIFMLFRGDIGVSGFVFYEVREFLDVEDKIGAMQYTVHALSRMSASAGASPFKMSVFGIRWAESASASRSCTS